MRRIIYLALVIMFLNNCQSNVKQNDVVLTDVICNYFRTQFPNIKIHHKYSRLDDINFSLITSSISNLQDNYGILGGFLFCRDAYFLSNKKQNKLIGYIQDTKQSNLKSSTPSSTILFFTEQLSDSENKIIIILSRVSPARLTIFSFDKNYKAEVLYDSFKMNVYDKTTIGSIENIKITGRNTYLLQERNDSMNQRFFGSAPRKIFMSYTNGFYIEIIGILPVSRDTDD